jgi:hypothetical protein
MITHTTLNVDVVDEASANGVTSPASGTEEEKAGKRVGSQVQRPPPLPFPPLQEQLITHRQCQNSVKLNGKFHRIMHTTDKMYRL